MAPRRRRRNTTGDDDVATDVVQNEDKKKVVPEPPIVDDGGVEQQHLPPLPLVATVMICSGFRWMHGFRDMMATGRPMGGGSADAAWLNFTGSSFWFEDAKGWRSTLGGLSAVASVTTDANRMGELFVRKFGGAAELGVHTSRLAPLLFPPDDASWDAGHYEPMLWTTVATNALSVLFWWSVREDLADGGADELPKRLAAAALFEALVAAWYAGSSARRRRRRRGRRAAKDDDRKPARSPRAVPSRIVARTVALVSGAVVLVAGRDLLAPGRVIPYLPRDEIWLEWTGALVHSPPEGSPEFDDHGGEAALHTADRLVSRLTALCVLTTCACKFASAYFVRTGRNGRDGEISCRIMWRGQAITDALLLVVLRVFASAALTASLDLRWHLMLLGYETFILGLYGFF